MVYHITENELYEQIEQYLQLNHPDVPHHWDLAGIWTPSHKARNLYGRLNARAWPDLFIAKPRYYHSHDDKFLEYPGLFIEVKREGTKLKKRDGTWKSDHIAEQAAVLEQLAEEGFIAQFGVGYDECITIIESYLNPPRKAPDNDHWPESETVA